MSVIYCYECDKCGMTYEEKSLLFRVDKENKRIITEMSLFSTMNNVFHGRLETSYCENCKQIVHYYVFRGIIDEKERQDYLNFLNNKETIIKEDIKNKKEELNNLKCKKLFRPKKTQKILYEIEKLKSELNDEIEILYEFESIFNIKYLLCPKCKHIIPNTLPESFPCLKCDGELKLKETIYVD